MRGARKEICEEKGVENIRKARRRDRKRGQGKKIITGAKNCALNSTFPGRDRVSRGETAYNSQRFLFFFAKNSGLSLLFIHQQVTV